jgi:anaerobic magnesium-protoporphyrin IX monomethyl ester cyclase
MERLEDYPRPALDLARFLAYYRRGGRGSAVVVAGRGCPFVLLLLQRRPGSWIPYRLRPVAEVMAELEAAVTRQAVDFIDFEDENLALDRAWFLDLLRRLRGARFAGRGIELRAMNGTLSAHPG